jgi:potassium voltage-gated channel Shab-related subfamily B protein 1
MNIMILNAPRTPKIQRKELVINTGEKYTPPKSFKRKKIKRVSVNEEKFSHEVSDSSNLSKKRAVLNVGGERHEILWKNLKRLPNTRLGKLENAKTVEEILNLCDYYNETNDEYYFNRHPRSFNMILNLYRTGKLHIVEKFCSNKFKDDLLYWGIEEFYLEVCCQQKYYEGIDGILDEIINDEKKMMKEKKEMKFKNCYPNIREKLWILLENPKSSVFARVSLIKI